MTSESRWTLPNVITVARIGVCPVIFVAAMSPSLGARFGAFALFVAAGLSDVWDGYLARRHGWVTDVGKLLDPIADKLLMLATFVPFYLVSHRGATWELPWWGPLPLWVLAVIFGRELTVTALRWYAARRGTVIPAGASGKRKALFQALFAGGLLLWYALLTLALERDWTDTSTWRVWSTIHETWIGVTLALALVLTVYSMVVYFWTYRSLLRKSP